MTVNLSPVMQGALAAGRVRFNALFAAARRGNDLDPDVFQAWIREGIAPAVDAAAALHPAAAGRVLEALFTCSLELAVQRVLGAGAREPVVTAGWRCLLPALPGLLSAEPAALSAAVVNALHRLAATVGARPEEWTAAMLRAGPRCADIATFRAAGLVAAWRAGLAQYRGRALSLARRMEPVLAGIVLGLEGTAPEALTAALDGATVDPWRSLEEQREGPWGEPRLALVGHLGAFRGFGGQFPLPPRVEARQGSLFACCGHGCWRLFADRYGAVLHREDTPPPAAQPVLVQPHGQLHKIPGARAFRPQAGVAATTAALPGNPVQGQGTAELLSQQYPAMEESAVDTAGAVRHRGLSATFQELAGPTSFASDGVTLAVAIATSHMVYLVARR